MTATGLLATAIALALYGVVAVALGRLALRLWRACIPASIPWPGILEGWAPALLAGQLVLTAALLITGFVPLSLTTIGLVLLALSALPLVLPGLRSAPAPVAAPVAASAPGPAGQPPSWVAWTALVLLYPQVVLWISWRPVVDWDARSIWFFHARALWVDAGLDPSLFTDPVYLHSAYPLLLPAQGAWLALVHNSLFADGWSDVGAKSFLLLNFAAYFQLLWRLLRGHGFPTWLALGASVVFFDLGLRVGVGGFGYSFVNGYADAHYIAPYLLALLAFALPDRHGGSALGVLLLAFGANVKLESGLYALLLALGTAALLLASRVARRHVRRHVRRRERQEPGSADGKARTRAGLRRRDLLLGGVILGGVPLGLWTSFRTLHGIRSYMDPLARLGDIPATVARIGERGGKVAVYLGEHLLGRGALWLALLWTVLVAVRLLRGHRLRRGEWVGVALVLGLLPVILGIYALTPLELDVHLRTSADRLLSLPLALLYGVVLLAAAPLLSSAASRRTPPGRLSVPRS